MHKLARIQADFQAYLMDDATEAAFVNVIVNDEKAGARKRLGIYYDAYRLRIIAALAAAYPKLKLLLGDDLFDSTAHAYIDQNPSTYRNLRWYGSEMRAHLQANLPQHPIVAEMADFEWALGLAFDAEDAPTLQLQDLANIPPECWADLKFTIHPSVQVLPLQWNVVLVWKALDAGDSPPNPVKTAEPCLIWRQDLNSHFQSINAAEFSAIQLVISGATFGELCHRLQDSAGEQAAITQAAQYLSRWLNDGLISQAI